MKRPDVTIVPRPVGTDSDVPSGPPPAVSVIIPTRNRRDSLRTTLRCLSEQTYDAAQFEVIVVDNLSSDGTAAMIEEMRPELPYRLRYHVMPVNRGPAPSRNQGAHMAAGPLLAFTDSDCLPQPGWLAAGVAAFAENVAFVSGPVHDHPDQRPRFFSRSFGVIDFEHPTYPTSNVFYRRHQFLEAGGFDERLCFVDFLQRAVECADTDLAWRLKESGASNAFAPGALVYHEVETLPPMRWLGETWRLWVVPMLIRDHPGLAERLLCCRPFLFYSHAWFYLAVAGLILAAAFHWGFLALIAPYLAWCAKTFVRIRNPLAIPKSVFQVLLFSMRMAVNCSALLYGSARARHLVL